MRKLAALFFGLCLFLFPASISHGQSEPEAGGLMMENQEDATKSKQIYTGNEIRVWMYDGAVHRGDLTQVKDSSFMIGTLEVPFSKTKQIKLVKGEGSRIAGIVGVVVGLISVLLGFLITLAGTVLIEDNNGNLDGCVQAFFGVMFVVLGVGIGIFGIIFLLIGVIGYALGTAAGKSFRFDEGRWKIRKR